MKCILLLLFTIVTTTLLGQTTLHKEGKEWQLKVDGEPYEIKGATFGYDNDVVNYDTYFKELQFLGVNTIRTWGTGKNTYKLLNAADKHGIKVMLGIWMRHGRPGMEDDDRFDYLKDTKGKEAMYENALQVVEKYKTHPALLAWGVGNEVYLNTATDKEKLAYSQLLERICSTIKKKDPHHLITSVEAWTFGLDWWEKHVPSLDIYGLNSYGPGVKILQDELDKKGVDKAYVITEFGVTGEWDIKEKINDVLVEPNDSQKYDAIASGFNNWIASKPSNLGGFVFHYATGETHLAPWLFTHYKNSTRPQFWAIKEAFTGKSPNNYVPEITSFSTANHEAKSDAWVVVNLAVTDRENETLEISFGYNQRTGSRIRRDQINPLVHRGTIKDGFEIQLPKENGPIKLYAFVKDSYNNMGIATTGILVKDETAKNRKYLVPKVSLPFYVYKDGKNEPYAASAFMGNYKVMTVNTKNIGHVFDGEASLKISYNEDYDWYGLGLVNPANDWGEVLGGYDVSGAKKFSFWAKASNDNVIATIGFGLIGNDKPFPDTAKKSKKVKLTTQWKKYTLNVKKLDLSCIRSGLTVFSSSYGSPQDIYIDNVVFE